MTSANTDTVMAPSNAGHVIAVQNAFDQMATLD